MLERIVLWTSLGLSVVASGIIIRNNLPQIMQLGRRPRVLPLSGRELSMGKPEPKVALVAVLSNHCIYCVRSIPFYRRISTWKPLSKTDFAFIAVFPEGIAAGQQYVKENGISVDQVANKPDSLPVPGTPTLLLVRNGKIEDVWTGRLDTEGEAAVARRVSASCRTCLVTF